MKNTLKAILISAGLAVGTQAQNYETAFEAEEVILTVDDFAVGPVVLDCCVLVGWFDDGGFGPRGFYGEITTTDAGTTFPPAFPPDVFAKDPFSSGPTSGERLRRAEPPQHRLVSWGCP